MRMAIVWRFRAAFASAQSACRMDFREKPEAWARAAEDENRAPSN
jgi:hypothetical protein